MNTKSVSWQLKRLWWKHSYTFHWAHKPLCERFQGDVLRFGKVHFCRSCFFAYAGLASAIAFVAVNRMWLADWIAPLFLTVATVTVAASLPWWYKRWPRWTRDILRAGIGWSVVLCAALIFYSHIGMSLVGGIAMFAAWKCYYAYRDARKRHACDGCAELGQPGVCSGFARQAECARAYEEEASELVMLSVGSNLSRQHDSSATGDKGLASRIARFFAE